MHRRAFLITPALMLLACGSSPSSAPDTSRASADKQSQASATAESCGAIAAEYSAAISEALTCDPSDAAACSAQRPLAVGEVSPDGQQQLTGLCFTANAGYASPDQTGQLDAIIARYKAAGCTVGACPGPPPHAHACLASPSGAFSCN